MLDVRISLARLAPGLDLSRKRSVMFGAPKQPGREVRPIDDSAGWLRHHVAFGGYRTQITSMLVAGKTTRSHPSAGGSGSNSAAVGAFR